MLGLLFGVALMYRYNPVRIISDPITKGVKTLDILLTGIELQDYKANSEEGITKRQVDFERDNGMSQEYKRLTLHSNQMPESCSEFEGMYCLTQMEWSILKAVFTGIEEDDKKGRPVRNDWRTLLRYYQELSKTRVLKAR